jgi:2-haloacid dehalogenase
VSTPDHDVAALACDTGGTVFDWHAAVHQAFERQGRLRGIDADWPALTKTWRRLSTRMVDAGLPVSEGRAAMNMDGVLEATLGATLERHEVTGFSARDRRDLVLSWRQMRPWPDVVKALPLLRERFIVCPFTILTTALVVEASRLSHLTWDAVISCEMIGVYKTDRRTYEMVARWLDLEPRQIMLVSTHNNDIRAARASGLQTAFVYRPDEWWDMPSPDPEPGADAELVAADFVDLAHQLGVSTT